MTVERVRELREAAAALAPELSAWRRELHRHPELGFEEQRTAAFVCDRLRALGLEPQSGIGRTGVAAVVRGGGGGGPGVLLRADMDALPIQEVAGREYGSQIPGCMHACGHDGHTAMLLGAARLLVEHRASLGRDVVLCFQPAEEGGGGAAEMLREGVLDLAEVGSVYALHLWTPLPVGSIHVRSGPTMAAQDEFRARLVGRGGHGALPHHARDPVVAAAQAIIALQSVVSRSVDPLDSAVVSIGSLHAGEASNVIPGEARMDGTLRSFHDDVRKLLRTRVQEVLEGTARSSGCRLELELFPGYPPVVNDAAAVDHVRGCATALFGPEQVHEPLPLAASEDFAYFLRQRPGAFVLLGAGNAERGITAPHHSAEFDFDEAALPQGAALLATLALG